MNSFNAVDSVLPYARQFSLVGKVLRELRGSSLLALLCAALLAQGVAQGTAPSSAAGATPQLPSLSASEIVHTMATRNRERAAALRVFTARRTYDLDYSGFPSRKHADMVVDVTFTAPHNKQLTIVSEDGSDLLRKRVLHKLVESEMEASEKDNQAATALSDDNYKFTLRGIERKDGRDCYSLLVEPRSSSKFLYKGTVWVDGEDFAVVHIEGKPAKNPSFWIKSVDIEHRYGKFGSFWLPVSNRSVSSTRLGGRAVLAIDYGTYKVEAAESSPTPQRMTGRGQ